MGKKRFKSKLYLDKQGVICPYCESKNITSLGNVQVDAGGASQRIECESCGSEWFDIYELVDLEEHINNTGV
jgi:DNA-directed RNA polymerase subunit RPC12/RpoP